MKLRKRFFAAVLAGAMAMSLGFSGCAQKGNQGGDDANSDAFINVGINVYYNDADHNYYSNESGEIVKITKEGQYSVTFDCEKDLSDEAKEAGVTSLTNLTAIYLLDMDAANGNQSTLRACNIIYDKVVVDGTELTVTMTEPKSAFKSSGLFDTNDPINGWDGCCIEETSVDTSNHVANFSTVTDPKKITITFTLSDMEWETVEEETQGGGSIVLGDGANPSIFSSLDFTSMDALTFTKYMGNGINLGNTMEAVSTGLGPQSDPKKFEQAWGQPVTTAEMLQGMKNCGFDSIRVPVAWANAMDWKNGDYTINPAYLDRVEEIVNYALDAEMFVIINDHWDNGWWAMFGSKEASEVDNAWKMYTSMWEQIADRFKNYSDMLIFESANEELGEALNNNSDWTNSGALSRDELYETTNQINQKFVDIVRKSGGNNDDRFLLIAGFNTDIDKTCDNRYQMPTDSAKNKLILSVHYYTPWNYCGVEKDARWGLKSELDDMDSYLKKMTKFTDAGYGIIIGEYAALPYWENGAPNIKSNTTEFTTYFVDLCARYNYVPMLWSCNDFFQKNTCTMATNDLAKLFLSHCFAEDEDYNYEGEIKRIYNNAQEQWADVPTYEPGTPVAWIMWNGGAGTHSVGDNYNPADNTAGIKPTDVTVDGAGTYTVSLEFEGKNDGLTFAALGLASGEDLYPGCYLEIKEIAIDGEAYTLVGDYYTSSDDKHCTRVNLYNEWVSKVPDDARRVDGNLANATPCILDKKDMVGISSISVTFELVIPE